jgi:hypothetical protein
MDETKIGDIVRPTTYLRQKQFGAGIVVRVLKSKGTMTVVFPSKYNMFDIFTFKNDWVEPVVVSKEKQGRITEAGLHFEQMQKDLFSL